MPVASWLSPLISGSMWQPQQSLAHSPSFKSSRKTREPPSPAAAIERDPSSSLALIESSPHSWTNQGGPWQSLLCVVTRCEWTRNARGMALQRHPGKLLLELGWRDAEGLRSNKVDRKLWECDKGVTRAGCVSLWSVRSCF